MLWYVALTGSKGQVPPYVPHCSSSLSGTWQAGRVWRCAPTSSFENVLQLKYVPVCSNFHYHWTDNFCVLQVWRLSDAHLVQQVINLIWILNAVQFFLATTVFNLFQNFPSHVICYRTNQVDFSGRLFSQIASNGNQVHFCCWQSNMISRSNARF